LAQLCQTCTVNGEGLKIYKMSENEKTDYQEKCFYCDEIATHNDQHHLTIISVCVKHMSHGYYS